MAWGLVCSVCVWVGFIVWNGLVGLCAGCFDVLIYLLRLGLLIVDCDCFGGVGGGFGCSLFGVCFLVWLVV